MRMASSLWATTSARAREGELKIEDNLEIRGDDKRNGKWVDERKGKGGQAQD